MQEADKSDGQPDQNANNQYRLDDVEESKGKAEESKSAAAGGGPIVTTEEGSIKKQAAMVTVPPTVVHSKAAPQITATSLFYKDNTKGGTTKDDAGSKLLPNSRTALI